VDLAGTAFIVGTVGGLPGYVFDFGHNKFLNPYGLPLPKGTPNTVVVAAPLSGYHSVGTDLSQLWDSLAPGTVVPIKLAGYAFADTSNTPLGCIQFNIVKPSPYPWEGKLYSAHSSFFHGFGHHH
jgi:hypothetical protein